MADRDIGAPGIWSVVLPKFPPTKTGRQMKVARMVTFQTPKYYPAGRMVLVVSVVMRFLALNLIPALLIIYIRVIRCITGCLPADVCRRSRLDFVNKSGRHLGRSHAPWYRNVSRALQTRNLEGGVDPPFQLRFCLNRPHFGVSPVPDQSYRCLPSCLPRSA